MIHDIKHPPTPVKYRPDIDGLRTLAVVPVLLFHAKIAGFSGGFVGVDVFFVISGYLITLLIRHDQTLGKFTIRQFYERRIKRIIPALFVMVAVTLAISAALFLPGDLKNVSKSALYTLVFASNVFFWRGGGYFGGASEEKPLLHTWSLSVEEQFYIFYPLLLILLVRLGRRWEMTVLMALAALSLGLAAFGIAANKSLPTFYLFPTRAWELLIGAGLALGYVPELKSRTVRGLVAALGVILIAASVFFYSSATPFPGFTALPPTLGAACIIAAGINGPHRLTPLLGSKPMVWIGLISYSLYLWHWPILVFMRYFLIRELEPVEVVIALGLSVIAAVLSWRYVEAPFRQRSLNFARLSAVYLGGSAVLATAAIALIAAQGLPHRFSPEATKVNAVLGTMHKCAVTDYVTFGKYYGCPVNLPSRDPARAEVVIWGDSHAQMYVPALERALAQDSLGGFLVPVNGCAPLADRGLRKNCLDLNSQNIRTITGLKARTVILAMNWELYRNQAFVSNGAAEIDKDFSVLLPALDRTILMLRASGKQVVLLGPIATPGVNLASELSRSLAYGRSHMPATTIDRTGFAARMAPVERYLALKAQDGVVVIRPEDRLCDAEACRYTLDGAPVFADANHLTASFAEGYAPEFASALR